MSYFADSAWNYLAKKINHLQKDGADNRRLLVIVPALPESATMTLAETFTNKCVIDSKLDLTIKIAQVVLRGWSEKGIFTAQQHNWLDDRGNCLHYLCYNVCYIVHIQKAIVWMN